MTTRSRGKLFALRPVVTLVAAMLLLIAGGLAAAYQHHWDRTEHRRQLTVQANILAASVTAAIAFNDRAAAQEYVDALMLDPRLDAVAVYDDAHHQVAGFQRAGSPPIAAGVANGKQGPDQPLLVRAPARQGVALVGSVYLRAAQTPVIVQLARYSGVTLLTIMAILMISALAVAQRTLALANSALHQRARELAGAYERLSAEMEQRTRTEEALRQSQKMEAIGQLSGGIAHDFNNLLMIIKGSLTLLEKRLQDDGPALDRLVAVARECITADAATPGDQHLPVLRQGLELLDQREARQRQIRHYLEVAQGGIDKSASLTGRLLSFARQQPLSPRLLNLDSLIQGMRPLLDQSVGSDTKIDYRLNSLWRVFCDSNQMESAILNLVINARDAMPGGGQIVIHTDDLHVDADHPMNDLHSGEYVRLRVQDSGTGMSEEIRRKAFDPFFTTKPVGKGTGLGLSTILGYVEQSRGVARIDSEAGRGTTITISLPRAPSETTPEVA
jgi:signal transduction histidine kinase